MLPPFAKIMQKLYFDAKHLEMELNGGGRDDEILGPFFQEKCPFFIKEAFWPISNAA